MPYKINAITGTLDLVADVESELPLTTKGDLLVYNGSDYVRLAVGSNDEILTADSTQSAGVKWAAAAAGGGGGYATPPFEDNGALLNGPFGCDTNTTGVVTPSDQVLYLQAFFIPSDCTLNYLTAWCSVAAAGSTFRMGIYDHSGNVGPANLIAESAELSSASSGVIDSALLSTSLTAGWYWIGMTCNLNAGSPQFRGAANFKTPVWWEDGGSSISAKNAFYKSSVNPASSLPDPFGSTLTAAFSILPFAWLRLAF